MALYKSVIIIIIIITDAKFAPENLHQGRMIDRVKGGRQI